MTTGAMRKRKIKGCFAGTVLPYAVLRRAGMSAEPFKCLTLRRTSDIIERISVLDAFCSEVACNLPPVLHSAIGRMQSSSCKSEILQLKRDIHNNRRCAGISQAAWTALAELLTSAELEQLRKYLDVHQQRASLLKEAEQVFCEEAAASRLVFKRALRKREFQTALALASPALSYELDQYLNVPEEKIRRIRRTELSLMRYYSRAVFKLSQFSSFTHVGLLQLSSQKDPGAKLAPRICSRVALNRSLIATFAEQIAKHPELGGFVPVFLNSACTHEDNNLIFLRRVYNAMPARLRVPAEFSVNLPVSGAVEWIKAYVLAHDGQVPLRKLVSDFRNALPEPDRAGAFVQKLIDLGFLIHRVPLRDRESSGLESLLSFLCEVESPLAASAKSQLERLGLLAIQFASAGPQQRRVRLKELANKVSEIFASLGAAPRSWDGLLIFEDCAEEKLTHIPVAKQWEPGLKDLEEFVSRYASLLDRNLSARMAIAHVLRTDFAGGPVSLLEFLHHFISAPAHANEEPGLADYNHTPFNHGLEKIRNLAKLRDEMGRVIASSSDVEEVDLRRLTQEHQWPERMRQFEVDPYEVPVIGVSCHCQPVTRAGRSMDIVVNGFFSGALNVFLRYCNHLAGSEKEEVLRELQRILREAYPRSTPCELAATFDFNVNLHPPITEALVDSLDENVGVGEIKLNDLSLRLESNGRIALIHHDWDTEITAMDLGMMEISFANASHHFLSSLSNFCFIVSRPFHPYNWISVTQKKPVEAFPRLVFGRCILRRKAWSVLPDHLPHMKQDETDFAYFLRVQQWRRNLGIPEEVFVFTELFADDEPAEPVSRKAWNRRKPQYVHFQNFFLVNVFAKLIADTKKRLYVEEALPRREQWERRGSKRTTEVILNLCIAHEDEHLTDPQNEEQRTEDDTVTHV